MARLIAKIRRIYSLIGRHTSPPKARTVQSLVFMLIAAIMFARQPGAIVSPTFVAEDGVIFFKQQYEMGFLRALSTSYAGYYHAAPRVIAAVAELFPLEHTPLIYALATWIFGTISFWYFTTPRCEYLLPGYWNRVLLAVLMVASPDGDNAFKLNCIHWYFFLLAFWITITPMPDKGSSRVWSYLIVATAAWSSPSSAALAPLIFLRLFVDRKVNFRIWILLLLNYIVMLFTIQRDFAAHYTAIEIVKGVAFATSFRAIGDTFFGHYINRQLITGGILPYYGLTVGIFTIMIIYAVKRRSDADLVVLIIMLYMVGVNVMSISSRPWLLDFIRVDQQHREFTSIWHQRYFFMPTICLLFMLFKTCWLIVREQSAKIIALVMTLASVEYVLIHAYDFKLWDWRSQVQWRNLAANIRTAELATTPSQRIHIDSVSSPEWAFDIAVTPRLDSRSRLSWL